MPGQCLCLTKDKNSVMERTVTSITLLELLTRACPSCVLCAILKEHQCGHFLMYIGKRTKCTLESSRVVQAKAEMDPTTTRSTQCNVFHTCSSDKRSHRVTKNAGIELFLQRQCWIHGLPSHSHGRTFSSIQRLCSTRKIEIVQSHQRSWAMRDRSLGIRGLFALLGH
jgi:hypothetical protein